MPSSSGPGRGAFQPSLADVNAGRVTFGEHTTITCEQLQRSAQIVASRFQTTPALRRFVANADEEWRSATETEYAGSLRISTTEANGVAERFLRTFIEEVYLPRIAGDASDSAVAVDDVLSSPPRHDLSADRRFWTMLARFSIYRFREPLVDDETRSYVPQALECFAIIKVTYSCLTRRPVDPAVVQEANALIRRGNVSAQRARPVATHDNLVHFVRQGAFGSHLLLRCPREQIQMAAFHQLIAYCAVRPSDVVLGRLQSDALRWRDVDFFLTLWIPDEEDDSNDAAAQAAEERQVAEEADGQTGPGEIVGERATGARRASPRFRLHCDVTFRNVEGRPADPRTWRTEQLYDSGGAACLEPVLLLAQMADDDGIFQSGISIAHALEEADPSFFDNRNFLRVHIKREARDQFVFRAFELVDVGSSDDGAAASSTAAAPSTSASTLASTAGPSTSTSAAAAPAAAVASPSATIAPSPPPPNLRWTVSASEPCTLSMADATTARLANACGLPEFRSDAVLRMTIQMLERTSPSESGFLVVDAQGRRFVQAQASGRMATVKRILRSLAEPRQAARSLSSQS
ncbi:hypothetical protein PANT_19c00029 [Moesziomyces antarcticus T-34]|uniref:Uncharacterized protein n=1 Tax=Pseudozyma antarctica (strain T-34) TaxID=1151754 RepID=M9LYN3_PSEA3|nr:hypothetical protein PANT_19c00029 [Moesziomyces antarcticus T-34]